jgi:AraC-like DNA-binding protein/uncharacterized RmlC-like cupin family protein
MTKPEFESIHVPYGSSIFYERFSHREENAKPYWHYHPEIEIVYVNGGTGRRQIGSHISYYRNGDLILIGSNLPHCGLTNRLTNTRLETIIQFHPNLFQNNFFELPEMQSVIKMLEKAKSGVVFHGNDKREIGQKIESLNDESHFRRLLGLLEIFDDMQKADDYTLLNVDEFTMETSPQDNNKLNVIFNFVKEHYTRSIKLEEVAEIAGMTVPAFCRYFKKITKKTFTAFVNEYRVAHAAKLLHEKQISISEVCYDSGFNNISHFNRLFKDFFGKTPSVYRNELKYLVA